MSSFAERHLKKGRQEGMRQGEARVLLRLMERKFGTVSVRRMKSVCWSGQSGF
jgi:hypothetical protein